MEDFNERRMRSGSPTLDVDGRQVDLRLAVPSVPAGSSLRIVRESETADVEQAVVLSTSKGMFSVQGTRARKMVLWSSTAPTEVLLALTNRVPTDVVLYNGWRNQRWGNLDAGLRFSGMLIESLGEHRWRLHCSDGVGPADFTDLVLRVELTVG